MIALFITAGVCVAIWTAICWLGRANAYSPATPPNLPPRNGGTP